MGDRYYSTSTAFLEALAEAGISCMLANLGSDHPGLIEALAQAKAEGRRADLPELIVCPHETVALSAAHAYAAVSGQPQAVLVQVDSGTQNLGGAVNNASRGRVPVLILTEAITNFEVVAEHLRASRPGSLIGSGGGSLGWAGGGAVGAKLAAPDRTVVCLVGDGSFLFGVPSSAQWVARRDGTPTLTVIYNNRGWKAPKMSALALHPRGAAAEADDFNVSFEPAADLPAIAAAAGGAFGANVTGPAELPGVLKEALAAVHHGRSAVVAAHLPGV